MIGQRLENSECGSKMLDSFKIYKVVTKKMHIKGTVSVISSNSPWKDDNPRFTTIPLKAFADLV